MHYEGSNGGGNSGFGEPESGYNWRMFAATLAIRALVLMFLVGLGGSAVVVAISFIQDGKELFGKD